MSAELLINVTPRETRVAVVENGVLHELFIERSSSRGLVGSIFQGRVSRVLPGMQAAFIDIGLDRAAFLHANDIVTETPNASNQAENNAIDERVGREPPGNGRRSEESISGLVRGGQTMLVQVTKDPIGSKGARLTTHISIPSCYLVYLPNAAGVGVSQRIEDENERERLRDLVRAQSNDNPDKGGADAQTGQGGFIVRTAAEGLDEPKLRADILFLHRLWKSTQARIEASSGVSLVRRDLPLVIRTMRELVGTEIERVRIDSRETYRNVREFTDQFIPEMAPRIEHYPGERPIFDLYGVEDEIQKALERKVQLKSGGHLVFDQTEAMTTIDVNTGAYVGHRNLEETIFKTNLEAAQAIARQLRLRNLGGIIIIDFIDMDSDEHKRQVIRALEKSLVREATKTQISEVSSLGLVQMTRKRTRESLEHVLCQPCPTCAGKGSVKTPETVCYEIFREILREARQFDADKLLVLAAQEVIDRLIDEESATFAELETFIGKPIKLQAEPLYTQENYDVVLL